MSRATNWNTSTRCSDLPIFESFFPDILGTEEREFRRYAQSLGDGSSASVNLVRGYRSYSLKVEVERGPGSDYTEWFQADYDFAHEPEQKAEEWREILEGNGVWTENEPTYEPKITV